MTEMIGLTARDEFVAFSMSSPTLEQMANFYFSDALHERTSYLLDANQNDRLTSEEREELDTFMQVEDLATLMKVRAIAQIKKANSAK